MSVNDAILLTATLAAMACALPGLWLVLRRQSMMGDALSHTALPGIIIAFLAATAIRQAGWMSEESAVALERLFLLGGAVAAGVGTAWLTEALQVRGGVDGNAALGVVFTALFALGLFLVRFAVDDVHLDTDCVLFGRLAEAALDTRPLWGWDVPRAAISCGLVLLVNLLLMGLCYKELRIAAFDPQMATAQGIPARLVHYMHMCVTAVTAVAAFESVGSVLVIALLVTPAAAAQLWTDRLRTLIWLTLVLAGLSAMTGHWLSQTLPSALFGRLGFPQIEDASTPGMIAVTAGLIFLLSWLIAPRYGLIAGAVHRGQLAMRILAEDMLGALYRNHERRPQTVVARESLQSLALRLPLGNLWSRLLLKRFQAQGLIATEGGGYLLTPRGVRTARSVVRGHRLWETYVNRHFDLPADHLDSSAHRAEHFLSDEIQTRLANELQQPSQDPHGSEIPGQNSEPPHRS